MKKTLFLIITIGILLTSCTKDEFTINSYEDLDGHAFARQMTDDVHKEIWRFSNDTIYSNNRSPEDREFCFQTIIFSIDNSMITLDYTDGTPTRTTIIDLNPDGFTINGNKVFIIED
jgi:hypothetical protein